MSETLYQVEPADATWRYVNAIAEGRCQGAYRKIRAANPGLMDDFAAATAARLPAVNLFAFRAELLMSETLYEIQPPDATCGYINAIGGYQDAYRKIGAANPGLMDDIAAATAARFPAVNLFAFREE